MEKVSGKICKVYQLLLRPKKRVGKGAVGFYGTERTERSLKDFPVQPDSEEEEEIEFREQLHQWKKGEVWINDFRSVLYFILGMLNKPSKGQVCVKVWLKAVSLDP